MIPYKKDREREKQVSTRRFVFGDKTTAMIERIGHGHGVGLGLRLRVRVRLGGAMLLPSEGGAEEGKRFAGSGGGLEEGVAMAVSLSPI